MFGVECSSGDTFIDGRVNYGMTSMFVPDPVVSLSISPKKKDVSANFSKALSRFSREDPTFRVATEPESGQVFLLLFSGCRNFVDVFNSLFHFDLEKIERRKEQNEIFLLPYIFLLSPL